MEVEIDVPDDLYEIVTGMARARSVTFSQVVVELIRRGLAADGDPPDKASTAS